MGIDEPWVKYGVGFGTYQLRIGVFLQKCFRQIDSFYMAFKSYGKIFDEFSVDVQVVSNDDLHKNFLFYRGNSDLMGPL